MRLSVLGELELAGSKGSDVPLKSKKTRAVLAYLALHPRAKETRARLAGLLWGSMGDERARANLRQSISALRQALGDDADALLIADDEQVAVAGALADCDAVQVKRLTASADPADWERAARLAVADLLPTLDIDEAPFDEWLAEQRRAYDEIVCRLWSQLAAARRKAGDTAGAEGALLCWLAVSPAAEEAHRALMELYAATGRRAKALEQFNRCGEALQRVVGATPDAATVAVHQAISTTARAPTAALALPQRPSIAVAAFHAAPEDAWLGDGIAEDIIVALTRFDQLMVISRQSSFVFRDTEVDPRAMGHTFGVHYVLSGSLRRTARGARLSVQLADAQTGATVWAHAYDAAVEGFSGLAPQVLEVVVSTLAGRIEADQLSRAKRGQVQAVAAYEWLLKAKLHHHRYTATDNAAALQCLERSIAADPNLALAHAWKACVLVQGTLWSAPPEVFDQAMVCVRQAIELDEDESECHRILASASMVTRKFDEAERYQARALALNPHDDRIVCQQGELQTCFGRPADALPWVSKAMRLNPFHGDWFHYEQGRALYFTGDVEGARRALLAIRNPRPVHLGWLAAVCNRLKDPAQAARHLKEAKALNPGFTVEGFLQGQSFREGTLLERLRKDLG